MKLARDYDYYYVSHTQPNKEMKLERKQRRYKHMKADGQTDDIKQTSNDQY